MCGIAGVITSKWSDHLADALNLASRRLAHRGPDDSGTVVTPASPIAGRPAVALANRRLAILDLSPAGHQPMPSTDGRWLVVVNGEIYNYVELREELARAGVHFHSTSDTEVLVEALAAWGSAAFVRLQGMFAIAAYDRERQRVYLARDPFGIKPLYFAERDRTLVFASEIPALLEFPSVRRHVNAQHLCEFLTRSNTDYGSETLFADIHQVPSGCSVDIPVEDPATRTSGRYWALDLTRQFPGSFSDAAEQVRHAFLSSMRMHLRSDVPLGFALSGGLDSSAVVMAARTLLGPDHDLRTFSFIPAHPDIDERWFSDAVARAAGATSSTVHLQPEDLRADVETLSALQGEPIASPVIYAQYRVMRLARESGTTVVLGGQGADEILAGYDRYVAARLASQLRQGHWWNARTLLTAADAHQGWTRRGLARSALLRALPNSIRAPLLDLLRAPRRQMPWLDHRWFADRDVHVTPPWFGRSRHVLREMLAHNLLESQIQALMRYEDRNAMAFSIENRVPFLTVPFVELLFSLPEAYLLAQDGTRKAVFREAMRGIVPDLILDRSRKIGFSVPTSDWFESLRPWIAERLSVAARLPGLVRMHVEARRLAVLAGRPIGDPLLIWRWVSLATWVERFGVTTE